MKSPGDVLRFGEFTLDATNRRLLRGSVPVELGTRYFDTLAMLAAAPDQLISKDRLHEEVWRGVPVTDEALSQAIMAVRRALGDDAARPRFIETVPRHGYRFIGAVETTAVIETEARGQAGLITRILGGGLAGAAIAGLAVGLTYGATATPVGDGSALSLVLVLMCVSILAALVSGFGVAAGIAAAYRSARTGLPGLVIGGAIGGLIIGGFARLLGMDSLRLLAGSAPDRITGAGEGLAFGAAVGLACWVAARFDRSVSAFVATVAGASTGALVVVAGGTLMAGSLEALVAGFPKASLSLAWLREPVLLTISGAFEGALFTTMVALGISAASNR